MEVRVVKQNKKGWKRIPFVSEIPPRVLLTAMAVCLLTGFFVWWFGGEATQAGYHMDQDGQGRYIFHVVEVVPAKNQAVLGLFMEEEWQTFLSKEKLLTYLAGNNVCNRPYEQFPQFFYWEGKAESNEKEPFTLLLNQDGAPIEIISNEIFPLYILGVGTYHENETIYGNLKNNQTKLAEFKKEYVVNYQVATPESLEQGKDLAGKPIDIDKIHYLQIGSGMQLEEEYSTIYQNAAVDQTGVDWDLAYGPSRPGGDISWATALRLYHKALSKTSRMSVSISASTMINGTNTEYNIYKFYQMLNYFDNPSLFPKLFRGGEFTTNKSYIDEKNGEINLSYGTGIPQWHRLSDLASELDLSSKGEGYHAAVTTFRQEDNYIPAAYDNIMIYKKERGYFGQDASWPEVESIIKFTDNSGTPPKEEEEAFIRVLEIEPCDRYWLSNEENRAKFLDAIKEKDADFSVTYVTPHQLNGMTMDMVEEYDILVVGSNVDLFSGRSEKKGPFYTHIGAIEEAVIPQTLINGLLSSDYTTEEEFNQLLAEAKTNQTLAKPEGLVLASSDDARWNAGIRKQWKNNSGSYFLKNIDLTLELLRLSGIQDWKTEISRARFSGNDVSRYMQGQIAAFVNSGKPVVISEGVWSESDAQIADFELNDTSQKGKDQVPKGDARIYFALHGVTDERKYHHSRTIPRKNRDDFVIMEEIDKHDFGNDLQTGNRVTITITDTGELLDTTGNVVPVIAKKGAEGLDLPSLAKSNTLSFDYEIDLPNTFNNKLATCEMYVILDRNGDGIFDIGGSGKEETGGGMNPGNNATDSIKNDLVYTLKFSELKEGTDYQYSKSSQTITGRFNSRTYGPIDVMEELCEFRVVFKNTNPDPKYSYLENWTGYMRPDLKRKDVKILQIAPYIDSRSLSQNNQFQDLIQSLPETADYQFDFEYGFTTINESEFASQCADGHITAQTLMADYDLIIAGTDFGSSGQDDGADLDSLEAGKVLEEYIHQQKRPIIFTNDFMSYVNSLNYMTPVGNQTYTLADVSGNNSVLYPKLSPWNYHATQSLRYIMGMDRFAVTTDLEDEDKRDPGSSRRWGKVEELQGFTDGALLEYAYIATPGNAWAPSIPQDSIFQYGNKILPLGIQPRTEVIEPLNDGIIGHYPFEINQSEEEIEVEENHPPLYQLDLERELGIGKVDDVTVWYTFGAESDDHDEESRYFEIARKDALNNYYLYSKGKAYYTGFSLYQDDDDEDDDEISEQEMKLFINTIYAALYSGVDVEDEEKPYEAVVKAVGTVTNLSRSQTAGANNRYVCYYDEYDESLRFQFRIQKEEAVEGDVTPMLLGLKGGTDGSGTVVLNTQFQEDQFLLPTGITAEAVLVYLSPEDRTDESLATDQGVFYELTIPFGETVISREGLDGTTLVIAVDSQAGDTGSVQVRGDAIHAEIRLVMRNSFDLD